ncbi:phage tail tube protein [Pedobacter nyackensis]|uniref:phage tail tube protein n=1 Tax=Pedobacter nyackensis TaxID=475255 RepID=UPI00292D423F|nr:phage tail tube protein [Pedobacter nyackensis]
MQRNILTGSEFLLYNIDNEPVAYSTNCAIKINNSLTDVTTKNSDSWSEFIVGLKDWSIEFEGLVSYGDDFNSSYFVNKFQNSEPFFIRFGVLQDNFTHAFYGEVHIQSIDQTANDGEIVSYSGSLKGIGNLSFTDEGSPEQSGYLKTESDPVFRGSAAYGITDADKAKWNEANNKIVSEIKFSTADDITTLKLKFKDGNEYSTSFQVPQPIIDLSGFYTKSQADALISNAQSAADTANQLLYNIANDNKLSPAEKLNVLKEWQIIQDEKPKLLEQASQYLLDTINYEVSYNELELYVEPLLVSMVTTSDIEGFELRDWFRAYYDQRIILMKNINDAKINNIKIGSRNYHLNGEKVITISQTTNQTIQNGNYPINSDLGLSFYARSIDPFNTLYLQFDASESKEFLVTSGWTRYTAVTKSLDNPILYGRVLTSSSGSTSLSSGFPYSFPTPFGAVSVSGVQLKNIMVVEGNKVLDYTPAPEDYYSNITKNNNAIIASATTVVNVANTTTLLLAKADATAKSEAAKQAAILAASEYTNAQRILAEETAIAHADGIVTAEELARITQAENNLQAAKDDATNKANAAALYGMAATDLHNALVSNLKSMAFTDIQEVGNSGVTIVKNGNIMSFSLDVMYARIALLKAEYIEALNIITKNLKTSTTGKRVEIDSVNNNIRILDAGGNILIEMDDDSVLLGYNGQQNPIYGAGLRVGDLSGQHMAISKNKINGTGDIEIGGYGYFTNYIRAKNLQTSVLADSGSLSDVGLAIVTGNCNLYTYPDDGQMQTVKNRSSSTITISAAETTGRGILTTTNTEVVSINLTSGGVIRFQYYQPDNVWVVI